MAKDKEGEAKKKGKGKLIGIVLVAMIVGGVGAKFTVLSGGKGGTPTPAPTPTPTPGVVIDLGNLTINLAEPQRYALVGLAVELGKTGQADKVTPQMPLLKDASVRKLNGLTAAKLLSQAGQDEVRTELTAEAQQIFGKDTINRVLLTEVVVQ